MNVDPGFDAHNVLTLKTYVYGARYQKPEAELNYYEQAFARLRATPGIRERRHDQSLPLDGLRPRGFHIRDTFCARFGVTQRRSILGDAGLLPGHADSA